MHTISTHIVSFLNANSTIDLEHRDWCIYALEKKLYKSLCFFLVLVIGLLFRAPIESILIFISTSFLRTKISGWHAETPVVCVLITIGVCCGGGIFAKWIANIHSFGGLLLLVINIFLCLLFSPIDNVRLHLTKKEIQENKKWGIHRMAIMMVLSGVAFCCNSLQSSANCIQLGTFIALASTFIKE